MKTLEEIIARNDYKNLTSALKQKASELARTIRDKMIEVDIEQVVVKEFSYMMKKTIFHLEDGNYETHRCLCYLAKGWAEPIVNGEPTYYNLEETDDHGEQNNGLFASTEMLCCFVNNAREILNKIDEIETIKCKEIEETLNKDSKPQENEKKTKNKKKPAAKKIDKESKTKKQKTEKPKAKEKPEQNN